MFVSWQWLAMLFQEIQSSVKLLHVSTFLLLKGKFLCNYKSLYMHPIRQLTVNTILYQLERIQKNFEGILVGADRSKDLAVLKVKMPFDEIF
jgi:hypothetical protein